MGASNTRVNQTQTPTPPSIPSCEPLRITVTQQDSTNAIQTSEVPGLCRDEFLGNPNSARAALDAIFGGGYRPFPATESTHFFRQNNGGVYSYEELHCFESRRGTFDNLSCFSFHPDHHLTPTLSERVDSALYRISYLPFSVYQWVKRTL